MEVTPKIGFTTMSAVVISHAFHNIYFMKKRTEHKSMAISLSILSIHYNTKKRKILH
jgi:hypothetical protein